MSDYVESPRICYSKGHVFIRVCPVCGRFVKPDDVVYVNDRSKTNATCSKHGRVSMPYEGQIEYLESEEE